MTDLRTYEVPAGTGLCIDTVTREVTIIEDAQSLEVMNRLLDGFPLRYNGYTVLTHPGTKNMSVLAEEKLAITIDPLLSDGFIDVTVIGGRTTTLRTKVDIPKPAVNTNPRYFPTQRF